MILMLLLACKDSAVGDLRVTEFHPQPLDTPGQWLEISYLHRSESTMLGGAVLTVAGDVIELPDVELGPGGRFMIGSPEVDTAQVPLDLQTELDLSGDPTLTLKRGTEVIHTLETADLPFGLGSSAARDPELPDGEDAWCMSWEVGDGDYATPGELSGTCRCRVEFTFHFVSATDPSLDLDAADGIVFHADGQYNMGTTIGEYLRTSDELGQHVAWEYTDTGVVYTGTRPYGSDAFVDQPIEIPEDNEEYVSGTWSSTGICTPISG